MTRHALPADVFHFVHVFLSVLGRQIEPPSCGIPDPYRIKGRCGVGNAWYIAKTCWRIRRER